MKTALQYLASASSWSARRTRRHSSQTVASRSDYDDVLVELGGSSHLVKLKVAKLKYIVVGLEVRDIANFGKNNTPVFVETYIVTRSVLTRFSSIANSVD